MDKRSITLLNFLTASVLNITAQSLLLTPHHQEVLFFAAPSLFMRLLAFFLLLVSYLNISGALAQRPKWRLVWTHTTSAVATATVGAIYQYTSLTIEAIFFYMVGISHLLAIFKTTKVTPSRYYLIDIKAVASLLSGLAILYLPAAQTNTYYAVTQTETPYLGAAFIISAFLGGIANGGKTRLQTALHKLTSLPWLAWALLFTPDLKFASMIPAFFLAAAIIFSDIPFWNKITLPHKDILGQRIFPILYGFQTLTVVLLYFLLHAANVPAINVDKSSALQDVAFAFSITLTLFSAYGTAMLHQVIVALITEPIKSKKQRENSPIDKFVRLFSNSLHEGLSKQTQQQAEKIHELSSQLKKQKRLSARYEVLDDLRKQLSESLDDPVSAQIVVNIIQRAFDVDLVAILLYDIERSELVSLSAAGRLRMDIPAGYRQSTKEGLMGRAARLRKTQVTPDTRCDPDHIQIEGQAILTEVVVPLVHHGHLSGVISINSEKLDAFSPEDVEMFEIIADELVRAWDRSGYNQRLTDLIQASLSLTTSPEPEIAIHEISNTARRTLQARFVFTTLFDQDGSFTRFAHTGYAPNLLHSLEENLANNQLLRYTMRKTKPFRIRDIRKHKTSKAIILDHNMLRSLLAIPIRLHGVCIGAILAFGKQGGLFFSEKDQSLANLLATQAAAAVESSWLIQELRSTAGTTKLLYELSFSVIQTDKISDAAHVILNIAHQVAKASTAGIVIFDMQKNILTALEIDVQGIHPPDTIPMNFVEQTLASGKRVIISSGQAQTQIYLPIQTPMRKYGVLWIELIETDKQSAGSSTTMQTLANQAAIALERVIFLLDLRQKASELSDALTELEITYDQTLRSLMFALDARDHETEGHSSRVGDIACLLGEELKLSKDELSALRRGALLHDIGKIGVSDNILHKPGPLTAKEWDIMRMHPDIGASIINEVPFLKDTTPVIRHHHERWNGSGYPLGLQGKSIPLTARIFAVADVFDALTSQRPYRTTSTGVEALEYLKANAGILFDPAIVNTFEKMLSLGKIPRALK
ncbi:MAG: GAF domain-containing protein [Anaerolineales bacterium]|nr:GAF domain-containing protein [Anaerolineales bacterium]